MRPVAIMAVDDEPLARRKLASLVAEVPWAEQVGEACDGAEAVDKITRLRPDIVFLDVRMPELSGLEVLERLAKLDPAPVTVFTTSFDEYAVTAFELDAVDYLLKPFGRRRFLLALERARQAAALQQGAAGLARARGVLASPGSGVPRERIFVREQNSVVPVALADIRRIEGQDDYCMLHGERHHLVSLRLRDLEAWLPNPPFIRVHRSHIVNLDYVERLAGLDDSRFEVIMRDGSTVPVSRARSQRIRKQSR